MNQYIVDFNPYRSNADMEYLSSIEQRISNKRSITEIEANDYLTNLMYRIRKSINPNLDNYDYKCDLAQSMIGIYFDELNYDTTPCSTLRTISSNADGHNFTIVSFNVNGEDKRYLLDPTYIQFFKKDNCTEANYFIAPAYPDKALLTPAAGYFIREEDQEVVDDFLTYGYMELTEETAKIYGNSFFDSRVGINPKTTKTHMVNGEVYINSFLHGSEILSKTKEQLIKEGHYIEP